ncbi:MAG: NHL repeat-containing protein, partial [Chloroflexota bacterium]
LYAIEEGSGRVWRFGEGGEAEHIVDMPGRVHDLSAVGDILILSHKDTPAISIVQADGTRSGSIVTAGSEPGDLARPWGIAVSPSGMVYVSDVATNRIQAFDGEGQYLFHWGESGVDDGEFRDPRGIHLGDDGRLYVADSGNDRIQVFDQDGRHLATWEGDGDRAFNDPQDIEITGDGLVMVADSGNNRIQVRDLAGTFREAWGDKGFQNAYFQQPVAIAAHEGEDSLYVADQGNRRIQLLRDDGGYVGQWNSDASLADLIVNREDQLYVVAPESAWESPVRRFDIDGEFLIIRGDTTFSRSLLESPVGIAIQPERR